MIHTDTMQDVEEEKNKQAIVHGYMFREARDSEKQLRWVASWILYESEKVKLNWILYFLISSLFFRFYNYKFLKFY